MSERKYKCLECGKKYKIRNEIRICPRCSSRNIIDITNRGGGNSRCECIFILMMIPIIIFIIIISILGSGI